MPSCYHCWPSLGGKKWRARWAKRVRQIKSKKIALSVGRSAFHSSSAHPFHLEPNNSHRNPPHRQQQVHRLIIWCDLPLKNSNHPGSLYIQRYFQRLLFFSSALTPYIPSSSPSTHSLLYSPKLSLHAHTFTHPPHIHIHTHSHSRTAPAPHRIDSPPPRLARPAHLPNPSGRVSV